MLLIPNRGMGAVFNNVRLANLRSGLILPPPIVINSSGQLVPTVSASSGVSSTPQSPALGSTYTDASGNVWTYSASGWSLTSSPAPTVTSSPGTPATPVTSSTSAASFPANPVAGQTYTDPSGNVWTYTSTGWQEGAASATSTSDLGSWFTTDSTIAGISLPNYAWTAGGIFAAILAFKMLGGRKR